MENKAKLTPTESSTQSRNSTTEYLEQLSNESSEDILIEVLKNTNIHEHMQDHYVSHDALYFFVGILSKIASLPCSVEKTKIMTLMCNSGLWDELATFIMLLPSQISTSAKASDRTLWKNIDTFLRNTVFYCFCLFDVDPVSAREKIPKLMYAIHLTINSLESESLRIADYVINKQLTALEERLVLHGKEFNENSCLEEELLNDFRDTSIYPTSEEILKFTPSTLKKNKIFGNYKSVNEYLNINFRLLREDFVKPLREGINQYLLQENGAHIRKYTSKVKAYKNVKFLEVVYRSGEIGRKIQLDPKSFVRMDFIYGSLLCFTKDQFQTISFGRILSADNDLLKQKQLVVSLDLITKAEESCTDVYIMVKCDLYFEPYYVVLKSLQQLTDRNFPLRQFIVDVCPMIHSPKYLQTDTKYKIDGHIVPILDNNWPDENLFKLNHMQHEGFRRALTKELVIIQGPPGTGKTHVGWNIVRALLDNKQFWRKQDNQKEKQHESTSGPMLVLCYTNHALDQFLEGILKFTTSVVRVGGRSKSEMLKPCNLRERSGRFESRNDSLRFVKNKLIGIALESRRLNSTLDIIKQCDGVIDFCEFEKIEPEFKSTWFAKVGRSAIREWLTGNVNKRTYIEQAQFNHLGKHKSESYFETPNEDLVSELMTSLQTTDEANRRIEIHSGFDRINTQNVKPNLTFDLIVMRENLKDCQAQLQSLIKFLNRLDPEVITSKDRALYFYRHKLEVCASYLQEDLKYVQMRLLEGEKINVFAKPINADLKYPYNMSATDRWNLYFYWLNLYKKWAENRINELADKYLETFVKYEKEKALRDVNLMGKYDVIGMTTTGAARLQSSLQKLKCPIVVVEEAAEILESHVVASLTEHCQHLILIGDHQQLRPKTGDYNMTKDMQLGISLFERFILNDFEYSRLNIQHRMRPEISSLICPAIYPDLIDHPSVMNYPPVKGLRSSVYFIDHSEAELSCDNSSKKNLHEAKFLTRLAQHLLHNGYAPTDITILVAYKGQYFAVMQELEQLRLKDIPCAVLDNYQGEENKIILLSLVRNNNYNSIGFLQTENRVCVALSRAKEGLYIMGNMKLLCRNSKVWSKIKDALVAQDALGEYLKLCCQIHLDRIVKVKHPNDFDKVPNGCCGQICGFELHCGHKCELPCHLNDPEHVVFKCQKLCSTTLCEDITHMSKTLCYQKRGLCEYEVERTLSCGHTHKMPCHINVATYKCNEFILTSFPYCGHDVILPCCTNVSEVTCCLPCEKRLEECGHICTLTCHVNKDPDHKEYQCKERCSKDAANCSLDNKKHRCKNKCYMECEPCTEIVKKKKTSCGHVLEVPCSESVDDYVDYCSYPCEKLLQCGHLCQNKCGFSCSTTCRVMVEKVSSVCGHDIICECGDEDFETNTKCREAVLMATPAACGHIFPIQCYMKLLLPDDPAVLAFCPEMCTSVLACGHPCTGTCFECYQGRFHKPCTAPCEKYLICGHKCQLLCGKPCEPCFQKCSFSCIHKECTSFCGQQCFQCNRKCPRSCVHGACAGRCGYQFCTIDACMRCCPKTLACGHSCTGYCGEVCPKCMICTGVSVEGGDRYITLQECGHAFEINEIIELLERHNPVGIKMCPLCMAPLYSTHRLKDYIWDGINERQYILREIYTNFDYNEDYKWLSYYVKDLTTEAGIQIDVNIFTATESACLHLKKEILLLLSNNLQSVRNQLLNAWYICHREAIQFLKTTQRFFNSITFSVQETTDVLNEFKRYTNKLELIVVLFALDRKSKNIDFKGLYERNKIHLDDEQRNKIDAVISILFSMQPFSDEDGVVVKSTLKSLITDDNLKNIISRKELSLPEVVNYSSESWFRCPQGHLSPCGGQENPLCKICEKIARDNMHFWHCFLDSEKLASMLSLNNTFMDKYKNGKLPQ